MALDVTPVQPCRLMTRCVGILHCFFTPYRITRRDHNYEYHEARKAGNTFGLGPHP